jgi:hypothetical protein
MPGRDSGSYQGLVQRRLWKRLNPARVSKETEHKPGPMDACLAIYCLHGFGASLPHQFEACPQGGCDGVLRSRLMNASARCPRAVAKRHDDRTAGCRQRGQAAQRRAVHCRDVAKRQIKSCNRSTLYESEGRTDQEADRSATRCSSICEAPSLPAGIHRPAPRPQRDGPYLPAMRRLGPCLLRCPQSSKAESAEDRRPEHRARQAKSLRSARSARRTRLRTPAAHRRSSPLPFPKDGRSRYIQVTSTAAEAGR